VTRLVAFMLPLLVVAGCSPASEQPAAEATRVPFAGCGELTRPPAGAPVGQKQSAGALASVLPDLQLACAAGGPSVALRDVHGPTVINLWASWCAPCRSELPAFQRLADRYGEQVHVVGINTRDRVEAAASLATDLGLTIPTLADPDERLRRAIRRAALPVTIFVDRAGRVRYIHDSTALDFETLAALVRRHLDVPVTS
jgi:thiol-disulfide isomerase/thioredoxin